MNASDLQSRVRNLSYNDLVEAANFYFVDAVGTADTKEVERRIAKTVEKTDVEYSALKQSFGEVSGDQSSIDYLLRSTLLRAATGSEKEKENLEEALAGVNKSQVVVEVLFAIYAATLLGMAWIAKPPREIEKSEKREIHPDGSETVTTSTSMKEIPPPVEKLYGWIGKLAGK